MNTVNQASICPRCSVANSCAVAQGKPAEQCWCAQHPAVLSVPSGVAAGCYCHACLQLLTQPSLGAEPRNDR